jgi:hypothetical protein
MKRTVVLLGLVLAASQASSQPVDERAAPQMLCTPFISYANTLLHVLDDAAAKGYSGVNDDTLRRFANATVGCAQSGLRLWSHPKAEAELAAVEKRFETGTATTFEVRAARVDVVKASYCEAAFSNAMGLVEIYEKRKQVGLVLEGDVGPALKIVEGLVPVCGWSGS